MSHLTASWQYPPTSSHEQVYQSLEEREETRNTSATWVRKSRRKLTARALRRLDCIDEEAASSASISDQHLDSLITRSLGTELENQQPVQSAVDFLHHCGAAVLQDIKKFARGGGPDLSDLRHFSLSATNPNRDMRKALPKPCRRAREPRSKNPPTSSSIPTESAATSGPYDKTFRQRLIDGGIYPQMYRRYNEEFPALPANCEMIRSRLSQRRPSLSSTVFSDKDFLQFQEADAKALKEKQVEAVVVKYIRGKETSEYYGGGVNFKNLKPLTRNLVVSASPDIYYGAHPEQLHPRVRRELGGEVVPTTQGDLPVAPNFFNEMKGPEGTPAVAKLQACYAGALGARGMHSLLSYGQQPVAGPDNAYTLTSTYYDGVLRIFSTYRTQSSTRGGEPEYYMHELGAWLMTSSAETFRQGAAAYRNGVDWTREERDKAIQKANARVAELELRVQAVNLGSEDTTGFQDDISLGQNSAIQTLGRTFQSMSAEDSHIPKTLGEPRSDQAMRDHDVCAKRPNPWADSDSEQSLPVRKQRRTA